MSDQMRARPEFAEALGDWFVEQMSEPGTTPVATLPPLVSDDAASIEVDDGPAHRPHRRRLLLANAALIASLLAAVILVMSRPDQDADPTSLTEPDVPPAEPLVFVGTDVGPGRYTTPLLGFPVTLVIEGRWTTTEAGASTIALHSPPDRGEVDVTSLRWILMSRLGGWNTGAQAIDPSFRGTGSIEPGDLDGWLDDNDVVVLERREVPVDGRTAIVVDVRVDPGAASAPSDFPRDPFTRYNDSCVRMTQPCRWYRSVPAISDTGRGPRPDPVMHAGQTRRMWLIPVDGYEPILIEAVAPVGDERWLDEFETTTITSLDLGAAAPPAGIG